MIFLKYFLFNSDDKIEMLDVFSYFPRIFYDLILFKFFSDNLYCNDSDDSSSEDDSVRGEY